MHVTPDVSRVRDIGAQLVEGAADIALETDLHRFLQGPIALPQDLVHHRSLHAGGLKLGERLPGFDRVELFGIAHQYHARDAELGGERPETRPDWWHEGRHRGAPVGRDRASRR